MLTSYGILQILTRAEIERLDKEHDEIDKDLKLIESRSNATKDERQCESLGELGRQKRKNDNVFVFPNSNKVYYLFIQIYILVYFSK